MAKRDKPTTATVGLDAILEQLGRYGKFNMLNFGLLLVPIYLAGFYGSIYVFEAPDLSYRCRVEECEGFTNQSWINYSIPQSKDTLSKCERYPLKNLTVGGNWSTCSADIFDRNIIEKCTSFVYSEDDSAVKDFNLGCQDWERTLIGSVHNAGLFLSLPVTGFVSDRYGRKVALALACSMNGIFGFVRSFSVNYSMMVVFEFLEAGLGAGGTATAFVLAMELVCPKDRVFTSTIINVVYVIGQMTLAALTWKLQNWRVLLRIIYAPSIFLISYLWIFNESVRWLLSKERYDEAFAILRRVAKVNKVDLSEEALAPLNSHAAVEESETEKVVVAHKPNTFLEAIRSAIIRKRLAVCSFLWITCTFVYYGLVINSVTLAGNKYVNFILSGLVEIPANITLQMVLDRFGRKKTLVTTYILSGVLSIGLSLVPKGQIAWSLVLFLGCKFNITMAYSSVYIYVSEVFPTSARQSLLSVCSTVGRVGSTLAPLTPLLALYYESLPAIFFGSMALVASLLVFTLPETINVPLPDTIEEAERLSRRNSPV